MPQDDNGGGAPNPIQAGGQHPSPQASIDKTVEEEQRDTRKSAVRVLVTYMAAGFLFVIGAGFIAALINLGKVEDAKNVFLAILPISAAIVTFWFAGRNNQPHDITGVIKALKENENGGG